jgi:hypothetical protein
MRLSADAISDDFDAIAEERSKIPGVALTDAAEADHENFHCVLNAACSI